MKRVVENLNKEVVVNKRKVLTYMVVGLGVGLCVGYTLAKLARW